MAQTLTIEQTQRLVDIANGFKVFTRRVHAYAIEWPVEQESAREDTSSANTVNVGAVSGLASLVGKYNDDPAWDEFPAFLEHYRREIDEMDRE